MNLNLGGSRFACPHCSTLEGHESEDKRWAFEIRCKKSETQYVVLYWAVTFEEWCKRRALSGTDQEVLMRFYRRELLGRGARVDVARADHWLNERIFEGRWKTMNQAKEATLELVDKIAAGEYIDEVRWFVDKQS
jgi:hypothetical protein